MTVTNLLSSAVKCLQLQGGFAPLTPWPGALPLDPAGGPDPHIGSRSRARHILSVPGSFSYRKRTLVLVLLQPIKSWRWRACNWVVSLQVSSVQFVYVKQAFTIICNTMLNYLQTSVRQRITEHSLHRSFVILAASGRSRHLCHAVETGKKR